MMLGNIGVFLLAPFLATSTFLGFGANDGNSFASAKALAQTSNNYEWRDGSDRGQNAWSSWSDRWRAPVIRDIDPDQGDVGTKVTLSGSRFDADNIVRFGDGAVTDVEVSDNGRELTFTVPEYMGQYCPPGEACIQIAHEVTPGDYAVRVVNERERTSNAVEFTVTEDGEEPSGELAIASIDGPTSLDVDAEGTWTVNVEGAEGNLSYSASWGDEGMMRSLLSLDDEGQASATFTHTYAEPGAYTPEFTVTDEAGATVTKSAAKVTVGEDGSVRVDAIEPSSAPAGATVTLTGIGFDGDTKVWVGEAAASNVKVESDTKLTFTVPAAAAGDYSVRVSSDEGQSNTIDLEILKTVKARVSVSGVDAPTRLALDAEGTWTVHATSNTEGNLSYSVDWGEDKGMFRAMSSVETQSSATFTHAYGEPGTYHPKFTVTDENGNKSSVSASVVVR